MLYAALSVSGRRNPRSDNRGLAPPHGRIHPHDPSPGALRMLLARATWLLVAQEPQVRRSVPLPPQLVRTLTAHHKLQAQDRLALGKDCPEHDLLFCEGDGSPLDPETVTLVFDRRVRAFGLPRIRLHDLRHMFATLALRAGVHAKVVSEILGHPNISITLDTYSHAIPALQEEARAQVATLVFGGDGLPGQSGRVGRVAKGLQIGSSDESANFLLGGSRWARGDLNPHELALTGT